MTDVHIQATGSLCPVCLRRVPARRELVGDDGFLVKQCPEHGTFRVRFWHGPPGLVGWGRTKVPGAPPPRQTVIDRGCPFDCGLCPDHAQHTCTAVFEVTQRCNLGCPVCFAASGTGAGPDPDLETLERRFKEAFAATGPANVQLSGGEPTVRHDLPAIVRLARAAGYGFIQVNTNGLALAEDPDLARRLADAGVDSAFLQCDGVTDAVYRRLRGRELMAVKAAAMDHLAAAGIGIVLVPTIVAGINDDQIGDLVRLAVSRAPDVRGIHFQPAAAFGRHPWHTGQGAPRFTLPELMTALETQTRSAIRVADLHPPCCEHSLCSCSASYTLDGRGGLGPVWSGSGSCCGPAPAREGLEDLRAPIPADEGSRQSKAFVSRQWGAPPASPALAGPADDFSRFLERASPARRFSVSAMGFQDVWTLDLERARGCCIHVVTGDARLVPFCLYNLTAADGRPLYRRP